MSEVKSTGKRYRGNGAKNTKKQLAEAGTAYDGRPNSLPLPIKGDLQDGPSSDDSVLGLEEGTTDSPTNDPREELVSSMNSYDEKRYRQYWRLAAAEELDELSDPDNFFDATEDANGYDLITPDSGIHDLAGLDPEAQKKLQEEWRAELEKTESEILTLKQVLYSKMNEAHKLKRRIGITAWKEFKDDMGHGIKSIQETITFQKTSATLKVATEKTTSTLGSLGASVSRKFGDVKNSATFKSIGSAYTSVKTKVSSSRSLGNLNANLSNSVTSLDNQSLLKEVDLSSKNNTPATSPCTDEPKPIA